MLGNCNASNSLENDILSVFKWGTQGGLQKAWEQESKDRTHMRMWNRNGIQKLWNLHWALRTAWREKKGRTQRQRTEDESAQEISEDGQDLTICGGCQGYMDFFSEVFCVVKHFFLLYIFAHQETPRWKILSKTERNKHSGLLSRTQIQSVLIFSFCTSSFPIFDIREGNSPSLVG